MDNSYCLFDSHTHYFDLRFEGREDEILKNDVFGADVGHVINVGTNLKNDALCVAQAKKYRGMFAAVGIHPEDCELMDEDPSLSVAKLESFIGDAQIRKEKKIVAIGEIGLDYHVNGGNPQKARQLEFFNLQMSLAKKTGLPVIIHDREAHGDCFETVLRIPAVRGVFHSYSGSAEMARELIKRGWYISFSGVLTFKNASRIREVAATVPADRLLVETDCPYLTPHPHRGELNHSGLMHYTVEALAGLFGMSPREMAELTSRNAFALFQGARDSEAIETENSSFLQ